MAGEYDKSKYTKKERLQNFWYYSKYYIIIGVLVVAFIIVQIYKASNKPQYAFTVMFFNTVSTTLDEYGSSDEGRTYVQNFLTSLGLEAKKNPVDTQQHLGFDIFDGADEIEVTTMESMGAYIATGDLDMLVANAEFFEYAAYWEALEDLREVLDEETLKELEPHLFYMDRALADKLADYEYTDPEYQVPRPDPRDPSAMKDPIPVGIYLDETNEEFQKQFDFQGGTGLAGIYINAPHPDRCRAFIDYIFK